MKENKLYKEAELFGKYLVNENIPDEMKASYMSAVEKLDINADKTQKYIDKSIKRPWMLKYFDAAFAFQKTKPVIRRKLFIMLAIIEASPLYSDKFLEKEKGKIAAIFELSGLGIMSIISFIIGRIIIVMS